MFFVTRQCFSIFLNVLRVRPKDKQLTERRSTNDPGKKTSKFLQTTTNCGSNGLKKETVRKRRSPRQLSWTSHVLTSIFSFQSFYNFLKFVRAFVSTPLHRLTDTTLDTALLSPPPSKAAPISPSGFLTYLRKVFATPVLPGEASRPLLPPPRKHLHVFPC